MMTHAVIRRTFEAAKHPAGSSERARLNRSAETSEYCPGKKYLVRSPALMSDGTTNPAQAFHYRDFITKRAAQEYADAQTTTKV